METAIKVCASSLTSEFYGWTVIQILHFLLLRSSKVHRLGHKSPPLDIVWINIFEPNLSNTKFRLCLDIQGGICTLSYTTKNFVSISSLNRAWLTSYSSYPPRRKYGSSVRGWMQIWDDLIPYLTTIQRQYKYIYINHCMWKNYHAYTVNKTHVTNVYLQSVNYHHIEAIYKPLASNGPYHFSVLLCYFHTSETRNIFPSILQTL
jgi:hypothetical protein